MNLDIVLFISLNSLRIKKYTFQTQEKIGSFSFSSPNDHQELIGTDLEKKNLLNTFLKLDLSKTPMNSSLRVWILNFSWLRSKTHLKWSQQSLRFSLGETTGYKPVWLEQEVLGKGIVKDIAANSQLPCG